MAEVIAALIAVLLMIRNAHKGAVHIFFDVYSSLHL